MCWLTSLTGWIRSADCCIRMGVGESDNLRLISKGPQWIVVRLALPLAGCPRVLPVLPCSSSSTGPLPRAGGREQSEQWQLQPLPGGHVLCPGADQEGSQGPHQLEGEQQAGWCLLHGGSDLQSSSHPSPPGRVALGGCSSPPGQGRLQETGGWPHAQESSGTGTLRGDVLISLLHFLLWSRSLPLVTPPPQGSDHEWGERISGQSGTTLGARLHRAVFLARYGHHGYCGYYYTSYPRDQRSSSTSSWLSSLALVPGGGAVPALENLSLVAGTYLECHREHLHYVLWLLHRHYSPGKVPSSH